MKNVIMLLIDSFSYDICGDIRYGKSATEFLDSIKEKCLFAKNLYSQGPYTEAGLKALLCSCNTMDNGGYLQRFGNVDSFFLNPFKEKGYEIFHSYEQLFLYGDNIKNKIDNVIYIDLFDYRLQWEARIPFYIKKYKEDSISKYDIDNCIVAYDVIFSILIEQYCKYGKYQEKVDRFQFVHDIMPSNLNEISSLILEEFEKYKKDKKVYVMQVIKEAKEHNLYKKINIKNKVKISENVLEKVLINNAKFLKNSKRKYAILNKNCRFSIKKILESYFSDKIYFSNAISRWNRYVDYNDFINKQKDMFIPSMGKQILFMEECIKNKWDRTRPFFFEMHFEEAHYYNTFLSYDLEDMNILQEEIDTLSKDLKKINNYYPGMLQYRQSIVYVDYWISKLFKFLESSQLLDDTVVLITADHGSSYCYEPIRDEYRVTNCHTANYHIPMYIYNKDTKGIEIEGYHTSMDVIPTLLNVVGIEKPRDFKGESMLSSQIYPQICHSEYLGSGIPDIVGRPIQYSVRNKNYLVSYYVKASDAFEKGEVKAVYDLAKDPQELNNIKDTVSFDEIEDLIKHLNNRHLEINRQFLEYHKN